MDFDIKPSVLEWLLEQQNVGVRYLAMRDLTECDADELEQARFKAHEKGPIASILSNMQPEGYWVQPGAGYYPKYTGSVWSLILLAQLGGSIETDSRVASACDYILQNALTSLGQFSVNGLPSGTADCLQGNLCAALLDLGCRDERLDGAFEWMARSVTGNGVAAMGDKSNPIRYYAGKCGPNFACGSNNKQPCAWGAVKVILAFSKLPLGNRTRLIEEAIEAGADFLFSTDPARADYPCGYSTKPSGNWWKFGFPVFYVTDLLQNVEALAGLGYGQDPRLNNALQFIMSKQDGLGRWPMEYDYTGKTWVDFGHKKQASKWVTYRALYTLHKSASLK